VNDEVPEAIVELGTLYSIGSLGLVKSEKKAAKIWKRAVELGNVDAMHLLATCYYTGEGVKLDKKKAMALWRVAASHGHVTAQYGLSVELRQQSKHEEAFHYAKLAAAQGFTMAEFFVGGCLCGLGDTGGVVEADIEEARRWLARAAAKGHKDATWALAELDAKVDAEDKT
jgi:TPR repeat protein